MDAKLTLENFDAPGSESNRYILTSPYSLRACARLRIKPVELLPKSFSQFVEELSSTGLSQENMVKVYREYEAQREGKIKAAKKERKRLKQTLEWKDISDSTDKSPPTGNSAEMISMHELDIENDPVKLLPYKDQRILTTLQNHLLRKGEEMRGSGSIACSYHDQQQREERSLRKAQHQKNLIKSQERFEQQLIERQSILKLNAELDQAEKEEDLNRRMMQWERQRNLQLAIKAQEREEKIGHRDTKKISQVINYQKLELEDYVGCLMLEEQISEMMLNATQRKLDSAKKRTEEGVVRRQKARSRFEESRTKKDLNDSISYKYMIQSIDNRHKQAKERHQKILAAKETQIRKYVEGRLERSQQCKLANQRIEASIAKWQNEVDEYGRFCRERAHRATQQAIIKKCKDLHWSRERRERDHAANLEKLKKEHQARMEDLKMRMEQRKEKSDIVCKQKMTEIQKSRAMAEYSAKIRSALKEYTAADMSFADKCIQAEMYAALERT